jgi:hypothetical protein|uniref:hypothetical protein n=1 Tax=Candidatus Planktophila sp. TaxID=2175601 RepID=UPI00404B7875
MRAKGFIGVILTACLAFSLVSTSSVAASKISAGKPCKTNKQQARFLGQMYTCIKSGKKLIWSKPKIASGIASPAKPTPSQSSVSQVSPSQSPAPKSPTDSLNFKNSMIYNVQGDQLIRRADSGEFFDFDSRSQSKFNPIRLKAYQELNSLDTGRSHPNINFNYSISASFPAFLVEYSKRELDEAASLWNSYFDQKIEVNVYFVTEKDREDIKNNSWLQRNLPSVFTRFDGKRERPFISGGGGYWKGEQGWKGNIFLATASYLDHSYINYEWPAVAKHEFVHLVQDYAFARNGRMRGSESEWNAIQPQNFREGAANTISYLTAFRNLGWSSDALDWMTWSRASNTSNWKTIRSLKEARELIVATEVGTPNEAFEQSYGVGALMYEWVLGTYGLDGFKKLMNSFATATNFDQSVQVAFGISKDNFYDQVSNYVYQEYSRVFL